ncbi:ABC transporter substrate-binding protein [Enemella sp. A6]
MGFIAAALLLAGCATGGDRQAGDPGSDTARSDGGFEFKDGPICTDEAPGDPVAGGTLTLAMLTEPPAIDPAVTRPPAATGGVEVLAVFEPLLRYDPAAKKYVPQLAEAVEANDDFSQYTVTLREDATFSDGSPVDAEAVKWSMERYAKTPTAPDGALWNSSVSAVEVTDERTVQITLAKPWSTFEVMLSLGPGMIVAPSSGAGEAFTPIGAGPFVLDKHVPRESITMSANEKYWAGKPHLEGVRFIYLGSAQTNIETLQSGGAQVAMLRSPNQVQDLFAEDEYCGSMAMIGGGAVLQINADEGRPGSDPRVRKALQLAIDPKVVYERAFDGKGIHSSSLFPEYSQWHTEQQGLEPDPEEAKRLIEEAKADGFDGTVKYLGTSSGQDVALAVQAQWEAVGLTVEVDLLRSVPEQVERIFKKDYDTVYWAVGIMESDVYGRLSAALHSDGNQLFGTATTPERDALIDKFRSAPDAESQQRILNELQQSINDDVPFVSLGAMSDVLAWPKNVHGIEPAGYGTVLLGRAWIAP